MDSAIRPRQGLPGADGVYLAKHIGASVILSAAKDLDQRKGKRFFAALRMTVDAPNDS
jgi:hypothetical protein